MKLKILFLNLFNLVCASNIFSGVLLRSIPLARNRFYIKSIVRNNMFASGDSKNRLNEHENGESANAYTEPINKSNNNELDAGAVFILYGALAYISFTHEKEMNKLYLGIAQHDPEALEALARGRFNVKKVTYAFCRALRNSDKRVVKIIHDKQWKKVNLILSPIERIRILRYLIEMDFPEIVDELIPKCIDVINEYDELDGKNILWIAIEQGNLAIARKLLEKGVLTTTPQYKKEDFLQLSISVFGKEIGSDLIQEQQ